MKKIITALVLALVPVLTIPSNATASDWYKVTTTKQYRCAPGYTVCRSQYRVCKTYYIAPNVSRGTTCSAWLWTPNT